MVVVPTLERTFKAFSHADPQKIAAEVGDTADARPVQMGYLSKNSTLTSSGWSSAPLLLVPLTCNVMV